jgi:PAS domain S-box-containing protein
MSSTSNPDIQIAEKLDSQGEEIKKISILHVDDSEDFSNLFRLAFRKWFDVTSLSDSRKALELISSNRFDAVVTDYDMPDMNGIELLQQIKREFPHLPVIFYTGQGNEEITREAFLSGVTDYFVKEFKGFSFKERLVNSIRHAVKSMYTEIAYLREKDKALRYFNIANVITVLLNADQKVEMINNYGLELLGYYEEEILGKNWFDTVIPESDRERKRTGIKKIFNDDAELETIAEGDVLTRSGETKTITWSNSIIRNEDGKVEAILKSGQDITERKKDEKRIKHLNRVLKTIRNINHIIIQEPRKETLIRKVCESFTDVKEYKGVAITTLDKNMQPEIIEQVGFNDFFEKYENLQEQKSQKFYPPCYYEVLKQKIITFIKADSEMCRKCDFREFSIDNDKIFIPIKRDNNLLGIIMVAFLPEILIDEEEQNLLQDVAADLSYALTNIELKKMHDEYEWSLIQSEESYRTIFDSAYDAIIIRDAENGKTVDVNQKLCEIFGITTDEAANMGLRDFGKFVLPSMREEAVANFRKAVEKEITNFRTMLKNRQNRIFTVDINFKDITLKGRECELINIRELSE